MPRRKWRHLGVSWQATSTAVIQRWRQLIPTLDIVTVHVTFTEYKHIKAYFFFIRKHITIIFTARSVSDVRFEVTLITPSQIKYKLWLWSLKENRLLLLVFVRRISPHHVTSVCYQLFVDFMRLQTCRLICHLALVIINFIICTVLQGALYIHRQ